MLTYNTFNREKPDREEYLSWANADEVSLKSLVPFIKNMADGLESWFSEARYELTEEDFWISLHSLDVLTAHQYCGAIKDALRLLVYADPDEDERIADATLNYLEAIVSEEHFSDIYEAWKLYRTLYDGEDEHLLGLLGNTGKTNPEIQRRVKEVIWDEEASFKALALPDKGDPEIQKEVRRRLIEIAPLVKYLPQDRFENPYFDEWIDMGEYWTSFEYPDEEIFHFQDIKKSKRNSDERLSYLKNSVRTKKEEIELSKKLDLAINAPIDKKYKKQLERRDELLSNAFLDRLPSDFKVWFESLGTSDSQRDKFTFIYNELFQMDNSIKNSSKKIGRNDPCPCNSGKKYKKCCGYTV